MKHEIDDGWMVKMLGMPVLDMKTVGAAVRRRRKSLGHSLDTIAEYCGVSRRTLIKLEQGADVRFSTLTAVMASMGMTLDFSETTKAILQKDTVAVKESDDDWY